METPLDSLVRVLARLPRPGRRSAERAAVGLGRSHTRLLQELLAALEHARAPV